MMNKKLCRVLTFALAAVLVLGLLPAMPFAVSAESQENLTTAEATSGFCGENVKWTLKNGVLTIYGTGPMELDGGGSAAPWYASRESVSSVVVKDGVTSICDGAFMNMYYATSISIGKDVQSIGEYAFSGWTSLPSVIIPDNVQSIGYEAFSICNAMTSVVIGDGVTFIDYWAFTTCDLLETVTIGAGLEYLDPDTFEMCPKLKNIVFDSANKAYTSVNGVVYSKDKTALVYIPSGITGDLTIPSSVTTIREGALRYSYGLNSLSIPTSVKKIERQSPSVMGAVETIYYLGTPAAWAKVVKINCEDFFTGRLVYGPKLEILTQPKSVKVAPGQAAKVTVQAAGNGLKYVWQFALKGATKWTTSSVRTNVFTSGRMSAALNGCRVRCVVVDAMGNKIVSNIAVLYMGNPAKIATQPKSVKVAPGQAAKVAVKATGDGLKYTWQFALKGATKWTTSSVKTNVFTSGKMSAALNGCRVRCIVTDAYGTKVVSNIAVLVMGNPVKIVTQPKSVAVAKGTAAKVAVKATGDGLTYTWYFALKGATKWSVAATKTNVFTSGKMSAALNGCRVFCIVRDAYGNAVRTNIVALIMR